MRESDLTNPSKAMCLVDANNWNPVSNFWDDRISYRHNGSANILFADGHVKGFPAPLQEGVDFVWD